MVGSDLTSSTDLTVTTSSGIWKVFAGLIGFAIIIGIVLLIFCVVAEWKLFKKAGKPGWASIIPIYNMIVLFEIIGYKWYYIFFMFLGVIPIVGAIAALLFSITYNIKLAKSFGQSVGFGIGLLIVSPIFMAIIAFSKDIKYVGPAVNGDIDFHDLF